MKIIIIVAQSDNRAIGRENRMPWHLPRDLQYFKKLTYGHPVIMGRKTYESIGHALPGRQNIVISRNPDLSLPDSETSTSLDSALRYVSQAEKVYIIGGGELYHNAMPQADMLLVTWVHTTIMDADCFFPEIRSDIWQQIDCEHYPADEANAYAISICRYEKK